MPEKRQPLAGLENENLDCLPEFKRKAQNITQHIPRVYRVYGNTCGNLKEFLVSSKFPLVYL